MQFLPQNQPVPGPANFEMINQQYPNQNIPIISNQPTYGVPIHYQMQQHYINNQNDPFSNPYFNSQGKNYQNYTENIYKNDDFIPSEISDHDFNLNYNKYMVFFQYDSVNIFAFDFQERKWAMCPNYYKMKMLSYFRVVQLPDYSFIMTGGSHDDDNITSQVYLYNDGYFTKQSDMMNKRRGHSSIFFNNYVYVFGGLNKEGQIKKCERFNVQNNEWENIDSMNKARTLTSCCLFGKDKICVVGGCNESDEKIYSISSNKFDSFSIKIPILLENPFVVQINSEEIIIMGGYEFAKKNENNTLFVVNMKNGNSKNRGIMQKGVWSAYSTPYLISKNSFMIFSNGEDDELPSYMEIFLD